MTAEPLPTTLWPVPPQDGYTVDDLLTLPGLPPHTELIDGSLVFVSPQRHFHSVVVDLLVEGLRRTVTPELRIRRQMTVQLDEHNGPEPDICVVRAEAVTSRQQTCFQASDVSLAVEVVSPDSEARDRDTKPHKYARAGIKHFWLVEMASPNDHPVVQVYELAQVTKSYGLVGIHHERLKLTVPFDIDIDIDLADVDNL
ncbi:Uma2 family endonuclease [Streptomyces sp. NPDC058665]|uniref:Uma2 family endonuclease n=1 Tax=Streptomyces sp. NPDC058665 TaxID=3346586 RepID=UPI00364EC02F